MLENIADLAPTPAQRDACLRWFAFMENDVDFWPFGGLIHQKRHWSRVLVLALKIAEHMGLSEADIDALAMAASFHDTRRKDTWRDIEHGDRAAEYYRTYCDEHGLSFDPRAYLAVKWHVRHDEEGVAAVAEWDRTHPMHDDWSIDATTLLKIFKDADGLDRLRLSDEALNTRFLRMPHSHELPSFSNDLLRLSRDLGAWPSDEPEPRRYLVVVDVQNDFVDGALGTPEAREALPHMVEKVRNFDGTVLFTKDTHTRHYLQTQEEQNLPVEHCICGTPGWELVPELEEYRRKHNSPTYLKGSFGSPDLAQDLEASHARGNIESVEFIGLCTDICVISNALLVRSWTPWLPVSVDASCCAGVTPEKHLAALETMRSCQIDVR
ncbi:MAG: isochorismatase family protein [Coriobacteriales bacterium]